MDAYRILMSLLDNLKERQCHCPYCGGEYAHIEQPGNQYCILQGLWFKDDFEAAFRGRSIMPICPICNNDCLVEGERCDVGFGYHCGVQIEPDYCPMCSYVQSSSYYDPDVSFEQYEKCWELQIDPNPPIPICVVGVVDEKYKSFFLDQEEAYGNCHRQCLKMVEKFPELKIVKGRYIDLMWGIREHFWCVDGEIIVDPTKSQFPCGHEVYDPISYISKEKLENALNPCKQVCFGGQ